MELDGKVAIVTGASRGSELRRRSPWPVPAAAWLASPARRGRLRSGHLEPSTKRWHARRKREERRSPIPTNLADHDEICSMVASTVDHFGGVDILVNNAAVQFVGDLDQPQHRLELTMAINYWAPLIATRESYPHMERRNGGAIVNVSSLAALVPFPDMLSYGTSKIALEHLTLDAARVLHPKGINVNCFRIDISVASEGFIANTPGADRSDWEPCEVPAEGILWMLRAAARLHRPSREHVPPPRARRHHDVTRRTTSCTASDADRTLRRPLRGGPLELRGAVRLNPAVWVGQLVLSLDRATRGPTRGGCRCLRSWSVGFSAAACVAGEERGDRGLLVTHKGLEPFEVFDHDAACLLVAADQLVVRRHPFRLRSAERRIRVGHEEEPPEVDAWSERPQISQSITATTVDPVDSVLPSL